MIDRTAVPALSAAVWAGCQNKLVVLLAFVLMTVGVLLLAWANTMRPCVPFCPPPQGNASRNATWRRW